jgi:hypothetical protein
VADIGDSLLVDTGLLKKQVQYTPLRDRDFRLKVSGRLQFQWC